MARFSKKLNEPWDLLCHLLKYLCLLRQAASYEDRIRRLEARLSRASLAMSTSSVSSGRGGAAGGGTALGHAASLAGGARGPTQRSASLPPSSPVMAATAAGQLPPPLALSGSTLEEAVAAGALSPTVCRSALPKRTNHSPTPRRRSLIMPAHRVCVHASMVSMHGLS